MKRVEELGRGGRRDGTGQEKGRGWVTPENTVRMRNTPELVAVDLMFKNSFSQSNSSAPKAKISVRSDLDFVDGCKKGEMVANLLPVYNTIL